MTIDEARKQLQLRSLVKANGELELSLATIDIPRPRAHEVLVEIGAAPINPSDQGLLFSAADINSVKVSGSKKSPIVTAPIHEKAMKSLTARVEKSMAAGNEGAGTVVEAGSSKDAQALLGKKVAVLGGAMYSHYRAIAADQCLVLPEGASAVDGASAFINPLTALGMVETLASEGHTALVHTAAASSLGQMLLKICQRDDIPLVNVVRKDEQVALLKELGAKYIVNSSSPKFVEELTDAIAETGATIAFDAIGGGKIPGQLLGAMESALNRKMTEYSRYGSPTHKQVYIYGGLDTAPTELVRTYGMAWGLGGWLVMPFLEKIGPGRAKVLKDRVAAELKTTFKTTYSKSVTLPELLTADVLIDIARKSTGGKYVVTPNKK